MSTLVGSLPDFPIQNIVDLNNGNVDKELPDFDRAIEFNPEFSAAFMNHGSIHVNKKYYGFVFCDCNNAVTLNPSYVEASTRRDEFHIKKNFINRATADITQVNRDSVYTPGGHHEMARADMNNALASQPFSTNAYYVRGGY